MAATTTRTIRPCDPWHERAGMSPGEARVLIAVLSYYATRGAPVRSTQVRDFLREIGEPTDHRALSGVARRGWIKQVGKVVCAALYEPTDRGWRILGLMKPPRAA